MRGQWRRTELSLTQVAFADAAVATPPAALQLAVDAAITVLRVDLIIMAKAAGGPKAPPQGGHDA